jgi:acyl-CoA thioesterase
MSLSEATTPVPEGDTYRLDVPAGWRMGRGAFGGLTIAAMIRAIEHRVADPTRTLRSVTAELFAPVAAEASTISVDILRRGSSLTGARAALAQHGEARAHAVGILAKARPGFTPLPASPVGWRDLAPPEAPTWSQVEPSAVDVAVDASSGPEFAQHFEYRVVEGVPCSKGAARTVGWIRPRAPGPARDAAYIASLIDAWWPAALVRFPAMRPMATIAYTLDLIAGLDGLAPDAPLLYRGTVPVCADGYFLETRELWGEDGRLVAWNQQTFAIIV